MERCSLKTPASYGVDVGPASNMSSAVKSEDESLSEEGGKK